ncbi:BON domain-containing protein [Lysobacter yangpyeongensis]|uniref:BON domain-containing protein n=1 Tax=Lysobacter yangpyeongensis TaxID=346182 RepID=A0ABW0SQK5_9GAMM
MNVTFRMAAAFAAGALVMYYLDPIVGRRRRAQVRDRRDAVLHGAGAQVEARARHAADRARGAMAKTRDALSREPLDDERLRDRIRARLGHVVEHAGQVEVQVHDGHVVLSGHADAAEIKALLATVAAMRGVEVIENRLSPEGRAESGAEPGAVARH